MIQHVHFESKGNLIFVKPPILYVSNTDVVEFHADDDKQYNIVIPNKDGFFAAPADAIIDQDVSQAIGTFTTTEVNNQKTGAQKGYSVTFPDGGITEAPPKIIVSFGT